VRKKPHLIILISHMFIVNITQKHINSLKMHSFCKRVPILNKFSEGLLSKKMKYLSINYVPIIEVERLDYWNLETHSESIVHDIHKNMRILPSLMG